MLPDPVILEHRDPDPGRAGLMLPELILPEWGYTTSSNVWDFQAESD